MANKAKTTKRKLKTMQDEILDRLDHIEDCLEYHANAGIRNDNQIAALEEAICPRVAARLTALERTVAPSDMRDTLERLLVIQQGIFDKMGMDFSVDQVEQL